MPSRPWTFTLPGFQIDEIWEEQDYIQVQAHSISATARCPSCHLKADRMHSSYRRTLNDLPIANRMVQLLLTVHRFRCLNGKCLRKTFVEPLTGLALKYAQHTQRFTSACIAVGLALGGEAGQRMADNLHLALSADTLLRILRQTPIERKGKFSHVIGLDDWAFKRSASYGTLIVDLEQHRPIEVLSDRTAESVAAWLQRHPEVQFVARDRSTEYARGISLGAPHAQQVADRWHLLKNLTEVLERILCHLRAELSRWLAPHSDPSTPIVRRNEIHAKNEHLARIGRREQRKARYEQVRALAAQGLTERAIAQQLHMSRNTIRKFVNADLFPEMAPHSRASGLDPFEPYLQKRWQEGCRNALRLWREIHAQGYRGTRRQMTKWVCRRREVPRRFSDVTPQQPGRSNTLVAPLKRDNATAVTMPSAKRLAWLLVKAPEKLDTQEMFLLELLQQHPVVASCYLLTQQFTTMVRKRTHEKLPSWLKACRDSGIPEFTSFAAALKNDLSAIRAALIWEWNNGQLEGQINRLKLLKRQMYGRANFDLLRIRVLARV